MNWRDQCGVVIPCLNEATNIHRVVAETRSYLPTVVVVDDGSVDETFRVAVQTGAFVLQHGKPMGKGAALATGLRWLRGKGFTWALTLDGDGQHAARDIPKFLEYAMRCDATLLVGDRMRGAAEMPWLRRTVNRWLSHRLSRLAGQALPDSQCGFRLLQLEIWAALDLHTSHFEIESEMLLSFIAARQTVAFVPIEVIYKKERSKIDPIHDSWRWLHWWWQARRSFAQVQALDSPDGVATPGIAANP
ncbi:MAG: glycosyltransferase family 2 protein [Verrucomicrobiales bacterium]|nr:glycosyltransferase family 2 protein [Verrucomicrobiales bacterium]